MTKSVDYRHDCVAVRSELIKRGLYETIDDMWSLGLG